MVGVPTDARDLGAAEHLVGRVVDVYHVFEDDAVVVHFDPFGDAGDGEKLPVLVKLDGRNDGSRGEHVWRMKEMKVTDSNLFHSTLLC